MAAFDPAPKPLTLRYQIGRYMIVMLLTGIALAVVDYLVGYFFQYQIGAGVGVVTAIVPAMDAGVVFAQRNKRQPEKGEAWRLSVIFLTVNMGFGAVMVSLLLLITGIDVQLRAGVALLVTPLGLGMIAVFLAIFILATRFSFGSGARNELKRQAVVAKKEE